MDSVPVTADPDHIRIQPGGWVHVPTQISRLNDFERPYAEKARMKRMEVRKHLPV